MTKTDMKIPRRGRVEWERLVSELESSDETQEAFAARHGLNVGSLRGWLYRIRRERMEPRSETLPSSVRFVAVTSQESARVGHVELQVGAILVRVDAALGPAYVAALAKDLAAQC